MQRDKILIIEPRDFLGKYLQREFIDNGATADEVHIGIDLSEGVTYDAVYLHPQGDADLTRRTFTLLAERGIRPRSVVLLSSTDVYGRDNGEGYTEDTPCTPDSDEEKRAADIESIATEMSADAGARLTILRLPPVVGTGMEGVLRKLVNGIYRGSLVHIEGNEARKSVVHATDVARAARLARDLGGVYNVTDGADPTVHDLMEALAHRLDDKRIFSVTPARARRMAMVARIIPQAMNRQMLAWMTSTLTFDPARLREATGFEPHSVTEYLRSHNYDENSL